MPSDPDRPFTARADPAVEARVARDVARLREAFLRAVPDLEALVLVGAFGRGEGSVVADDAGLRPLNDYDLVLVHRAGAPPGDLAPVRVALAAELGFEHVDVELVDAGQLDRLPPTMHAFDLKAGGRVIAGDPRVLERIPAIAPEQVGLGAARLLLFNRLTCLLQAITADDLSSEPAPARRLPMAYMAHKVMLSVATAKLARAGQHAAHYAERARRFAALYHGQPDLVRLVEASTRFKLAPPGRVDDPRPLWFEVREAYLSEIAEVCTLTYGRAFPDWEAFAAVYEGNRPRDALRKLKWWVLDRRKLSDIRVGQRRADVELAELHLTAAPRRDGTFDPAAVAAAARRVERYLRARPSGFEACRREAVRLDLTYLHPV